MKAIFVEPVSETLAASPNPRESWLCCDQCQRFFQYKHARVINARRWGCPFCYEEDFGIFAWDALRPEGESPWPSSTAQLRHGMKAPDMEPYYTEQARQEREDILRAFSQSPEWAALGRSNTPIWTEHMLYTFWTWTMDPLEIGGMCVEDTRLEVFAFWSDAQPEDAADIVPEVRAYFAFAERVLGHREAPECAALYAPPDTEAELAREIGYVLEENRRKPGCTRPVRLGAVLPTCGL